MPANTLRAATARLALRDYRKLNPTMSSPSYLFVNHEGIIEAAGLIGDEDWLALVDQLHADIAEERAA